MDEPSIIGRERFHIDALALVLHGAAQKRYEYTSLRAERRGATFEVRLRDPDGDIAGTARVTVELLPPIARTARAQSTEDGTN